MNYKYFCNNEPTNFDGFITLGGVILGFVLAIGWDTWKKYTTKKSESEYAERALMQELKINNDIFNKNLTILNFDNNLIQTKSGNEISSSPEMAITGTGESLLIKGIFDSSFPEYAEGLRNFYATLSRLNAKIANRELFKATNGAMTTYEGRRLNINNELIDQLEEQIKVISKLSKEMPKWTFFDLTK